MPEGLHLLLMVLGFVAILYGVYYVTRLLAPKLSQGKGTRYIKIADRIYLDKDKSICIIQVGEQLYLVGITPNNIELIGLLDGKDLVPAQEVINKPFLNFLDNYLHSPKKPEGEKDKIMEIQEGIQNMKDKMRKM